nr:MAG TPA: hypothetical protein [Caudoviricetes sp.]
MPSSKTEHNSKENLSSIWKDNHMSQIEGTAKDSISGGLVVVISPHLTKTPDHKFSRWTQE